MTTDLHGGFLCENLLVFIEKIYVKQNDYTYLAEITFNKLIIKLFPCS